MSDDIRLKFEIGDRVFAIPEEVSYRQYEKLSIIISDLTDGMGSKPESTQGILSAVQAIIKSGKVPEILATLLVPVDARIWKPQFVEDHIEIMKDIGDRTAVLIITNFLSGRMSLTEGLISGLQTFKVQKSEPQTN
jgi:hypothetical protein